MCIISNMLLTFYNTMTFIYIFYIFLTRIISISINIQLSLVFLNIICISLIVISLLMLYILHSGFSIPYFLFFIPIPYFLFYLFRCEFHDLLQFLGMRKVAEVSEPLQLKVKVIPLRFKVNVIRGLLAHAGGVVDKRPCVQQHLPHAS